MDENANGDALTQEELEKMLREQDSREFKAELLGEWVKARDLEEFTQEEMEVAQRNMEERLRKKEYEYVKGTIMGQPREAKDLVKNGGSLDLPHDAKPITGTFPLPVSEDPGEFVMPIVKGGYPKDVVDEIVSVQPLASGIIDHKLPAGTCETCEGTCVRPGSGDTCGACNGTGMTDEAYKEFVDKFSAGVAGVADAMGGLAEATEKTTAAAEELADAIPKDTLSDEEQKIADALEVALDDSLEALYDPENAKKTIRIPVHQPVVVKIINYRADRFTGWDVRYAGEYFDFTPK